MQIKIKHAKYFDKLIQNVKTFKVPRTKNQFTENCFTLNKKDSCAAFYKAII